SDLRETLAVEDREDREEILGLAQVACALGCLQLAFHFFTIRGRHGKTHAAHRDVPPPMRLAPRWQECPRCVAASQYIFQKIFFLRSIETSLYPRTVLCKEVAERVPFASESQARGR